MILHPQPLYSKQAGSTLGSRKAWDRSVQNARRMDLAGLHSLLHQPVVIPVTLVPLDAATAAANEYAINGGAALDVGSIVFVQRLP
jgi:hypothetical protein